MSYVVLKCGSAARGDANVHSDVDFVCIHTKQEVPVDILKCRYPNISFLSLEAIRRMKEKGSLFLAHLDVDGAVVEGEESLFAVVAGFRPHQSALKEAITSTNEFVVHIDWFPASTLGALWLRDVLFVAFRNIIYSSNALRSIYHFGLQDAMAAFGLSQEQTNIMYQVREGKYAFRSDKVARGGVVLSNTCSLSYLATTLTQVPVSFQSGGRTEWTRDWKYDYWDERLIERAIINQEIEDRGFRQLLKDHNYNRRILPEVVRKYVTGAQQAESTVPSQAAPSAPSDAR